MEIHVRTLDGRTIAIQVEPSDTIDYIMEQIEEKDGMPIDHQCIVFAGKHLPETWQTVSYYNIQDLSTVYLVERIGRWPPCDCDYCRSIYINVEVIVGKSIILDVEPSDSVDTVREKIWGHQKLFFDGKQLDDARTLASSKIQNECTLHLDFGMHIFVETVIGKPITVQVDPSDTIGDIKTKVEDRQTVIFNGRQLDRQGTLTDYNIQTGSTLRLDQSNMRLTVETQSTKTVRLKLRRSFSIGKVKEMIQNQQRIIFEGKKLRNGRMLSEYYIPGNSTLHIRLGGMRIFVKTPKGQTIKLGVQPADTIHDVKKKIQRKQFLLSDGKKLENRFTLLDYGIQGKSILQLDICEEESC